MLILWECKQIVLPIRVLFGSSPVITLPEYLNYFVCEKLVEILFIRTLSKNLFVHSCDCHVLHVITFTGFFWFFVFILSPQMVDQLEECILVGLVKLSGYFITHICKEYKRFFSQRCVNPMIVFLTWEFIELSFQWCSKCSEQLLETLFHYYLFVWDHSCGDNWLRRSSDARSRELSLFTVRMCADKWFIIEYLMILCQLYQALIFWEGDTRLLLCLASK